jgi:hypothetical protein
MATLQTLQFGAGIVFATPSGGQQTTNPTPIEVGVLQNVKVTLGADIKSLYGQLQYPVDTAIGKRSIKGSFEFALIELLSIANAFAGDNIVAGRKQLAYREPGAVSPGTQPAAFQDTHAYTLGDLVWDGTHVQKVTIAGTSGADAPTWSPTLNATTVSGGVTFTNVGGVAATYEVDNPGALFLIDLGVRYSASGVPLVLAASGNPAQGEYTVQTVGDTAGTYTFNAADEGVDILVSYKYTDTTGSTLQMMNHTMGFGPIIGFHLVEPYQSNSNGLYLPNVRVGKMDASTKLDDYLMNSSDFEAFALPSGLVGEMYANS